MSTNANITIKKSDNHYETIYLHWDGYLKGAGKTLLEHYNSTEQVETLIALGNLSSLYASPECPTGHSFNYPQQGYCVAYGRDRGESEQQATKYSSALALQCDIHHQDHNYLWDGEQWLYNGESFSFPQG